MSPVLPDNQFFVPTQAFLDWLNARFDDARILDAGAGVGLLGSLRANVVSYDLLQRFNPLSPIVLQDARVADLNQVRAVMVARPDSREWAMDTLRRAQQQDCAIIYVTRPEETGRRRLDEDDLLGLGLKLALPGPWASDGDDEVWLNPGEERSYAWVEWDHQQGLCRPGERGGEPVWYHGDGSSYMPSTGRETVHRTFTGRYNEVWQRPSLVALRQAHAKAGLRPGQLSGWLEEDGTWHPCGYEHHSGYAWSYFGVDEQELERRAVKISAHGQGSPYMGTAQARVSALQRSALRNLGLDAAEVHVHDSRGVATSEWAD